jgi:hypothetical protein
MQKPKPTKKPATSASKPQARTRRATRAAAPKPAVPAPSASATTTTTPVAKPRPVARTHRRSATPAAARGADLVRYLRIHLKKPYGVRGENAIVALAREVGRLGNIELGAVPHIAEGNWIEP